jgi:hypothetical protein
MKKSNINPESFKEAKTASTVLGQATMNVLKFGFFETFRGNRYGW